MVAVGWGLSDGSSPIRNIFPKEELVLNAGAFRKEGLKRKPEQVAKLSGSDLIEDNINAFTNLYPFSKRGDDVFARLDKKLGGEYYWNPAAGKIGGELHYGPNSIVLTRTQSTTESAGYWKLFGPYRKQPFFLLQSIPYCLLRSFLYYNGLSTFRISYHIQPLQFFNVMCTAQYGGI